MYNCTYMYMYMYMYYLPFCSTLFLVVNIVSFLSLVVNIVSFLSLAVNIVSFCSTLSLLVNIVSEFPVTNSLEVSVDFSSFATFDPYFFPGFAGRLNRFQAAKKILDDQVWEGSQVQRETGLGLDKQVIEKILQLKVHSRSADLPEVDLPEVVQRAHSHKLHVYTT